VRIDVALASCVNLPDPDDDMEPLLGALRAAGLSAEVLAWDDPGADFAQATMTLLRSTWNYPERPDDFRAWVARTAAVSNLWNRPDVVRWNVHKGYLLDLERRDVPVVPTELVARASGETLEAIAAKRGWNDLVVKPAISAGSRGTMRVREETRPRGEDHLRKLLRDGDALVQPYVASVEGHGERSMVWIDGEVTHAVRKSPRFPGDPESTTPVPVGQDERELALRAVDAVPFPLLYARVDMARDDRGVPRVMELELIEPSLFFPHSPVGLARYVATVKRLV
jgi:glutathione synthase/RimK-type ligase-like ATP-grasp enzyme